MNLRLQDALSNLADALITELDGDACALSRVIGEVLILVTERVPDGGSLQQGQGYLVSDFPQTEEVLLTKEPRALTLDDSVVDEAEARLLQELGFGSLLMTPLELNGEAWGLVEVYRRTRRAFTEAEIRRALELSRVA